MKWIDLTQPLSSATPAYPGDTRPQLKRVANVADDGFENHLLVSGMHAATHLDGPRHMLGEGPFLSEVDVSRFAGRGVLLDARGVSVVGPVVLGNTRLQAGDIVLVYTGFSRFYGQAAYWESHPVLTPEFAHRLVESGVSIVGMDTASPDQEPYAVHKILLGGGVLILENLTNLDALDRKKPFDVIVLPLRVEADSALARAVARVLEN